MIKSLLFDLDETLLPYSSPQEEWQNAFIESFTKYFSQWIHPDHFIPALIKSYEAMDENRGSSSTNLEIFSNTFSSLTDIPADKAKEFMIDYFHTEAKNLEYLVNPSLYTQKIMDWSFQNGFEVVIATGFQAPLAAAELRLGWAGIPVTDYDYKFIATWDNMHASKPHLEFYQEILSHIDRNGDECLFVGDDWESEIVPATTLGIRSYWVVDPNTKIPEDLELLSGYGQLPNLCEWLKNLFVQHLFVCDWNYLADARGAGHLAEHKLRQGSEWKQRILSC